MKWRRSVARAGHPTRLLTFAAILFAISCDDHVPTVPSHRDPAAATIGLSDRSLALKIGDRGQLVASAFTLERVPVTHPIRWTSSDTSVVSVTGGAYGLAELTARREGAAQVTATMDAVSASLAVLVMRPVDPDTVAHPDTLSGGYVDSLITVRSFRVVEFQYGGSTTWSYAPVVTLQASSAVAPLRVISADITFAGGRPISVGNICQVIGGSVVAMFKDFYGEYDPTLATDGARVPPGRATLTLRFLDPRGALHTVRTGGPIVAGSAYTADIPEPKAPSC